MISRDKKDIISTEINHDTFAETRRFAKGYLINPDYELAVYSKFKSHQGESEIIFDDNFYDRDGFRGL